MPESLKNIDMRRELLLKRLKYDIPNRVTQALKEDLGGQVNPQMDITSQLFPQNQHIFAEIITRRKRHFLWESLVRRSFYSIRSKDHHHLVGQRRRSFKNQSNFMPTLWACVYFTFWRTDGLKFFTNAFWCCYQSQ